MDEKFEYVGNELDLFKSAQNWKRYFTRQLKKHIRGHVLEVGSGIGANTPFFMDPANNISSWTLVEPDKKLFIEAKEALTKNSLTAQIDIEHINGTIDLVLGKKYDTVLYIDVIEHIEDAEGELKKAASVLKKKGKLIVLVPAHQFLYNTFDKSIGHYRRYNKNLLKEQAGKILGINELFYLDSMGFFAALLNKWILKKEIPTKGNIYLWDKILVPVSKFIDRIIFFRFGKSLIGVLSHDGTK